MPAKPYLKKPVQIWAIQFETNNDPDNKNANEIVAWINTSAVDGRRAHHNGTNIFVETLEGTMKANVGDYIIRGVKGEFYPCKPDVFEATYDGVIQVP